MSGYLKGSSVTRRDIIHNDTLEISLDGIEHLPSLFLMFSKDLFIILMGKNSYETHETLPILKYNCENVITLSASGDIIVGILCVTTSKTS